jgi:hypothetical protein
MDLHIFTQQESSNVPTNSFPDGTKVKEIAGKLCAKRKALEEAIKTTDESKRDELALELLELQKDMAIFGVSEIDYQVYLAQQNKN